MVWKGDARGRLAKGLITLIDQVDAKWPNRARHSDGSIGDLAHQARTSDHNLGDDKVVEAIDITHDPDDNGPDTWKLAETLRVNRDPRIDYVISNGRVFVGLHGKWNGKTIGPWTWVQYTGTNNHAKHVHVSIDPNLMDDTRPWRLEPGGPTLPAPPPPKPKGITDEMRQRMMKIIMDYEGKIPPRVFVAPDGNPEIAGITQKDHPSVYARLKLMLDAGDDANLVAAVIKYYLEYTAPAQNWTDRAGIEFFLRDCILNRGPTGAAEILQDAVGVEVDGQVGPTTRGALAALDSNIAIDRMRAARERYEIRVYTKEARVAKKQWDGLVNRWNKAQAQAKAFQKEQGYTPIKSPEGAAGTAVIVVGGGAAAAVKEEPWSWIDLGMAAFSIGIFALVVFFIVRSIRRRS